MQQSTILNSRDIKRLRELIESQFGYFPKADYAFLKSENDKINIVTKDLAKLNLKNLIIDKIGLYFGEDCGTEIRLSKEGAQLLGQEAKENHKPLKNVIEFTQEELKQYFQGADIEKDCGEEKRLVLLKYKHEIFGCAKYKEQKVLNFMPKTHRGEVII